MAQKKHELTADNIPHKGDCRVADDIKNFLNNPYICGDAHNVDFKKLYFGVKC